MELKLFGTDEFKDERVFFYIDRGDDLNCYISVGVRGDVHLMNIYGMASYCNHSVSPFYVGGDIPEGLVEKAYQILKNYPADKMKKMLDEFNEQDEADKKREEDYAEREEYEDAVIKDIKDGNIGEDGMYWLM